MVKKVEKTISQMIDEIGEIKAQLKPLAAREKILADAIKAKMSAGKPLDTERYHATMSIQHRSTTDWKSVCAEAKVPDRIIVKHTEDQEIRMLKVVELGAAAE